jgi:hypothetical protein
MGWRDRLADWMTGGKLTEAQRQLADARELAEIWCNRAVDNGQVGMKYLDRLSRIAAMETPNANATVRRMARIARNEE